MAAAVERIEGCWANYHAGELKLEGREAKAQRIIAEERPKQGGIKTTFKRG